MTTPVWSTHAWFLHQGNESPDDPQAKPTVGPLDQPPAPHPSEKQRPYLCEKDERPNQKNLTKQAGKHSTEAKKVKDLRQTWELWNDRLLISQTEEKKNKSVVGKAVIVGTVKWCNWCVIKAVQQVHEVSEPAQHAEAGPCQPSNVLTYPAFRHSGLSHALYNINKLTMGYAVLF